MSWNKNINIIMAMDLIKFTINEGAYVNLDSSWNRDNVTSPYSRLYFILGGDGIVEHEGNIIPLKPETVYLIPAGMKFNYRCTSNVEKFYMHINAINPDGYDMMTKFDKIGELPISDSEIRDLVDFYYSKTIYSAMQLKGRIYDVFLKMQNKYQFGTEDFQPYSKMIANVMSYVKENLSAKLNIENVSKNLFISPNTLSKKFKSEVGKPLGQYIDDLVFFESQRLLLYSDMTIGQVSEKMGFCDQFYFSRRFKQKFGENPKDYRIKVGTI